MADPAPVPSTPDPRPRLLVIACILGAAIVLVGLLSSGFQAMATGDTGKVALVVEQKMKEASALLGNDGSAQKTLDAARRGAMNAINSGRPYAMTSLVLFLVGALGVALMWMRRGTGFWLHLVATILGVLAPVYYFGADPGSFGMAAWLNVLGLIVVVLFAFNLKQLR